MKNISYISCPSCGFIMKPVWYLEKELDTHGIPTGRTHKACSCLLSLRGIVGADQIAQWDTRYDAKGKKVLDDAE